MIGRMTTRIRMSESHAKLRDLRTASGCYQNALARRFRQDVPSVSVIIPTFNRGAQIEHILQAWTQQSGVEYQDYEIVVADDGSKDETVDRVTRWADNAPARVMLSTQSENHGPAYARNQALAVARGRVVLIVGDDIFPPVDFLLRHLAWHKTHPDVCDALLGRVCWPSRPEPSPFMKWIATRGRRFFFDYPETAGSVSADRFYTCNVSLKKALFDQVGGFDESFPYASHEDLEMGMRLAREGGMRLFFDPDVTAVHEHPLTPESGLKRVFVMGMSAVIYWQRFPVCGQGWKTQIRPVLLRIGASRLFSVLHQCLARLGRRKHASARLWMLMLTSAFWCGAGTQWRKCRIESSAGRNSAS